MAVLCLRVHVNWQFSQGLVFTNTGTPVPEVVLFSAITGNIKQNKRIESVASFINEHFIKVGFL